MRKEIEDQLLDIKIIQAMTDYEKAAPNPRMALDATSKARLCASTGCTNERINTMLDGYSQTSVVHTYLQNRKRAGLPMPATIDDLYAMMHRDRAHVSVNQREARRQRGNVRGGNRAILIGEGYGPSMAGMWVRR